MTTWSDTNFWSQPTGREVSGLWFQIAVKDLGLIMTEPASVLCWILHDWYQTKIPIVAMSTS